MDSLQNATILAIDDDPHILLLLKAILANKCKKLVLLNNSRQCVEVACHNQPNLILLDVMIGQVNGYEVCKQLKDFPETQHIPVIFLSALGLPKDKVKGFEAGGIDYIAKPFDIDEALARISSCLRIHKKIQPSQLNQWENLSTVLDSFQLKKREIEILQLYIAGHKRSDIAEKVHLSENTVKWYLKQVFQKLAVETRAQLQEKIRNLS